MPVYPSYHQRYSCLCTLVTTSATTVGVRHAWRHLPRGTGCELDHPCDLGRCAPVARRGHDSPRLTYAAIAAGVASDGLQCPRGAVAGPKLKGVRPVSTGLTLKQQRRLQDQHVVRAAGGGGGGGHETHVGARYTRCVSNSPFTLTSFMAVDESRQQQRERALHRSVYSDLLWQRQTTHPVHKLLRTGNDPGVWLPRGPYRPPYTSRNAVATGQMKSTWGPNDTLAAANTDTCRAERDRASPQGYMAQNYTRKCPPPIQIFLLVV
jgi:hypothetical protein